VDGRPVAWVARAQACVLERQCRDWLSQHQPLRMIRDIGAGTLAWDDVAHPVGAHAPDSCQLPVAQRSQAALTGSGPPGRTTRRATTDVCRAPFGTGGVLVVVHFTHGAHTTCLQTAQVPVITMKTAVRTGGAPSAGEATGPRSRLTRRLLPARRGHDREEAAVDSPPSPGQYACVRQQEHDRPDQGQAPSCAAGLRAGPAGSLPDSYVVAGKLGRDGLSLAPPGVAAR
jgi:hypothetical protein